MLKENKLESVCKNYAVSETWVQSLYVVTSWSHSELVPHWWLVQNTSNGRHLSFSSLSLRIPAIKYNHHHFQHHFLGQPSLPLIHSYWCKSSLWLPVLLILQYCQFLLPLQYFFLKQRLWHCNILLGSKVLQPFFQTGSHVITHFANGTFSSSTEQWANLYTVYNRLKVRHAVSSRSSQCIISLEGRARFRHSSSYTLQPDGRNFQQMLSNSWLRYGLDLAEYPLTHMVHGYSVSSDYYPKSAGWSVASVTLCVCVCLSVCAQKRKRLELSTLGMHTCTVWQDLGMQWPEGQRSRSHGF